MLHYSSGTSVPPSLDSPEKGTDFKQDPSPGWEKDPTGIPETFCVPTWWQGVVDSVFIQPPLPGVKPREKSPILAVSLRPLPVDAAMPLEFEVTVSRLRKKPKVYTASFSAANRLVAAVNNLRWSDRATVCPSVVGWTAYIDLPVKGPAYPPPEVQR